MITNCWDGDRSKRRSAVECFSTLKHYHGLMVNAVYDVYLICHSNRRGFSDCIYNRLTQRGLNVLFINRRDHNNTADRDLKIYILDDQDNQTNTIGKAASTFGIKANFVDDFETRTSYGLADQNRIGESDLLAGISSSQIFLVCIDQAFQDDDSCLFEIKEARKVKPPRPIVPLFLDANYTDWLNDEIKYYCRMGNASVKTFDISESVNSASLLCTDEVPIVEVVTALNVEIDILSEYLRNQLTVNEQ